MADQPPAPLSGLALSREFYQECIRPLIDRHFPGLPYAAALLGPGSEVLGFDDPMSRDHDWGPRSMIFLSQTDYERVAAPLHELLAHHLPPVFRGYPTNFTPPDPNDNSTRRLEPIDSGPVNHRVAIKTWPVFIKSYLNFDVNQLPAPADWLSFPEHKLRALTAGEIFHDNDRIGLGRLRSRFTYFPRDTWLYLLAAGWSRLSQEEHLMGRAGTAGDELGSALIAAQLVRDIMRLAFLIERVYAPYPKWFGSAFQLLACAPGLTPYLRQALTAPSWSEREAQLLPAYRQLAALHNSLTLTRPLPEEPRPFFNRPFKVIAQHGFAAALVEEIRDPAVIAIAQRPLIGGLEQWSDNTDLLSNAHWRPAVRHFYEPDEAPTDSPS